MDERVLREKQAWNDGIERDSFEELWSHAAYYWDQEVDKNLHETMAAHNGGRFLEIGSATWMSWVNRIGLEPGSLDCINISEAELEHGVTAAEQTRVKPKFHIMDAHSLDFEENSFDVVFGKAILHHLDYAVALDEIKRVLKPGGIMVFMEPLDINPAMRMVRALTPALRTPDEEPIRGKHLALFNERFDVTLFPIQLLSAVASLPSRTLFRTPENGLTRTMFKLDRWLSTVPGIRLWFRSVVIVGRKRA